MTISLFLYAKIVSLYRFTSPWCTKLPMSLLGSICSSPMICWWKFIHSSAKPRNRTEAPKTEAVGFWFCWAPFGFWILRTEVYENRANRTDWTDYTECPALLVAHHMPSRARRRMLYRICTSISWGEATVTIMWNLCKRRIANSVVTTCCLWAVAVSLYDHDNIIRICLGKGCSRICTSISWGEAPVTIMWNLCERRIGNSVVIVAACGIILHDTIMRF